jgi:hypothetical protein
MRCLNCHTAIADTDPVCPFCRASIAQPGYQRKDAAKPFFAIVFMVVGGAAYNFLSPAGPHASGIDMSRCVTAGFVGGLCALVGGVLDYLLRGNR